MSREKDMVVGGSYREPGVGARVWGCWGGWPRGGKGLQGRARREKAWWGRGKADWTEAQVTDVVTLGRFWTRASGGGW